VSSIHAPVHQKVLFPPVFGVEGILFRLLWNVDWRVATDFDGTIYMRLFFVRDSMTIGDSIYRWDDAIVIFDRVNSAVPRNMPRDVGVVIQRLD